MSFFVDFITESSMVNSFTDFQVIKVSFKEAISTLYNYRITFDCHINQGLADNVIDEMLQLPCSLVVREDSNTLVEVHGILRRLDLVKPADPGPIRYRAVLVPRLWNTTRVFKTEVYQKISGQPDPLCVEELITEVLGRFGLEATFELAHPKDEYPLSEYVVQYRETDFDFISRLLEHWGLYYYFRQEGGSDELVISDSPVKFQTHIDYQQIEYHPAEGTTITQGTVQRIRARYRPQPSKIILREYNYQTPSVPLLEESDVDTLSGVGAHWHFGDHFKDSTDGKALAKVRAEQLLTKRETYTGRLMAPGIAPGHKFELYNCPVGDLDKPYVITSIRGNYPLTDTSKENMFIFTAVPYDTTMTYRPKLKTAKPRIHGFIHGFIDGPVIGGHPQIDSQGRYKVIMPMDTASQPGGSSSRWIRMAQVASGPEFGIHFPLHVGTEVAISHVDGDPDRPVIIGSIPNPDTSSPVVYSNASQSRIRTTSGILMEFEDDV